MDASRELGPTAVATSGPSGCRANGVEARPHLASTGEVITARVDARRTSVPVYFRSGERPIPCFDFSHSRRGPE